jgi:hypothetical protein
MEDTRDVKVKRPAAGNGPINRSSLSSDIEPERVTPRKKVHFSRKQLHRRSRYHRSTSDDTDGIADSACIKQPQCEPAEPPTTENLSADYILRGLARLDNRSVPKPEMFDSSSGQPFAQFLATFEDYCTHNFRGSSSLWIGELGKLLSGDTLRTFNALKVPGDGYETLKSKLLK